MIALADSSGSGSIGGIDLQLKEHQLAVTFLGPGTGSAALFQGPEGENILVISGGKGSWTELKERLSFYGVKIISRLIITGEDELNSPQIKILIGKFHIKEIIAPWEISKWLREIYDKDHPIVVKFCRVGTKMTILPGMQLIVLHVGIGRQEGMDFILQVFRHRLFYMTSRGRYAGQRLLQDDFHDVNIFKVSNIAKSGTSFERLAQKLNPQVVVLESPDWNIKSAFDRTWSELYWMKQNQSITIKFTESDYEVFTIPVKKGE